MYTLLYSKQASSLREPNKIINEDGDEVEYTCMHDEIQHGNWQESYKWPDTIVVGYALDMSKINYIGKSKLPFGLFYV